MRPQVSPTPSLYSGTGAPRLIAVAYQSSALADPCEAIPDMLKAVEDLKAADAYFFFFRFVFFAAAFFLLFAMLPS